MKVPPRQRVKPGGSNQRSPVRPPPKAPMRQRQGYRRETQHLKKYINHNARQDESDFIESGHARGREFKDHEPDWTRTDVYLDKNSGEYHTFNTPDTSVASSPGQLQSPRDRGESCRASWNSSNSNSHPNEQFQHASEIYGFEGANHGQSFEPFSNKFSYDVGSWNESFQQFHQSYQNHNSYAQNNDQYSYGEDPNPTDRFNSCDTQVYFGNVTSLVRERPYDDGSFNQQASNQGYFRKPHGPNPAAQIKPLFYEPCHQRPSAPFYATGRSGPQRQHISTVISQRSENTASNSIVNAAGFLLNLTKALAQLDHLKNQPDNVGRYTREELIKLYNKAVDFTTQRSSNKSTYTCHWLYRDKTCQYYADIHHEYSGIMEKYSKDYHGDPKSPINGKLHGLFFNVVVDPATMEPPQTSMFGERRLNVPVKNIFRRFVNMYFTDFYCTSRCHYVTLVLTCPGSQSDIFCQQQLVQLNAYDNPFFQLRGSPVGEPLTGQMKYRPVVEIFVTEDINIHREIGDGAFSQSVSMVGFRLGGDVGIPKNKLCTCCNIEPAD